MDILNEKSKGLETIKFINFCKNNKKINIYEPVTTKNIDMDILPINIRKRIYKIDTGNSNEYLLGFISLYNEINLNFLILKNICVEFLNDNLDEI